MPVALRFRTVAAPVTPPPPPPPPAIFRFGGGALPTGATLARASTGTRFDATGALVSAGVDAARFDFDPKTLAFRGLLIEPARTNFDKQSQDVSAAVWVKTQLTAASATRVVETTATALHALYQLRSSVTGATYSYSAIVSEIAGAPKRYFMVRGHPSAFGTSIYAVFDLAAGTFLASPAVTASMGDLGGGKWLVAWSATATADQTATANVVLAYSVTGYALTLPSSAGDVTAGFNVFAQQFEAAAARSSFIFTTGATATRAADVLTLDWSLLGIADGPTTITYTFDDATTQAVSTTIAGGTSTVPTNLARARLVSAEAAR